jgi:hypothetical protein
MYDSSVWVLSASPLTSIRSRVAVESSYQSSPSSPPAPLEEADCYSVLDPPYPSCSLVIKKLNAAQGKRNIGAQNRERSQLVAILIGTASVV